MWHTKLTEDVLLPDSGQKSHKVDPGVDDGEQKRRGPAEWIWLGYFGGVRKQDHWVWSLEHVAVKYQPLLMKD